MRGQMGFTAYVDCVLLEQDVVSDSSDLDFFPIDVDSAYLVTCIGHVIFSVTVYAVQVCENWVYAINFM